MTTLLLLITLASPSLSYDQSTDRLTWEIAAPSLAVAQAGTYTLVVGNERVTLAPVTCALSASVLTCGAARPASVALGSTVRLVAQLPNMSESAPSDPLTLPLPKTPTPTNLRFGGAVNVGTCALVPEVPPPPMPAPEVWRG